MKIDVRKFKFDDWGRRGRRSGLGESLGSLLGLLFKHFLLPTLLLIVIIDVAALALALRVDGSFASVGTLCGHCTATVLVVAVIAHA